MERDILSFLLPPIAYNFNSHAHVERDWLSFTSVSDGVDFNSHAHVERDGFLLPLFLMVLISTHTLTWSVTPAVHSFLYLVFISTHTLTWSVTWRRAMQDESITHFNSHAHVERDTGKRRRIAITGISTHTLTWSVTVISLWHMTTSIFQLTRSRGA